MLFIWYMYEVYCLVHFYALEPAPEKKNKSIYKLALVKKQLVTATSGLRKI